MPSDAPIANFSSVTKFFEVVFSLNGRDTLPEPIKSKSMQPSQKIQKSIEAVDLSADESFTDEINLLALFSKDVLLRRDEDAESFKNAEPSELVPVVLQYSRTAEDYARETLSTAGLAVLDAWLCGCALNAAKAKLKHGNFQNWFHKEFSNKSLPEDRFCLRTAQRYMQLARDYPTAGEVISSRISLRQAYQACSIIPAAPETEKTEISDGEAEARTRLLKSVSSIQNRLRQFTGKNITIDKETRKELLNAKKEINRLFASLCG